MPKHQVLMCLCQRGGLMCLIVICKGAPKVVMIHPPDIRPYYAMTSPVSETFYLANLLIIGAIISKYIRQGPTNGVRGVLLIRRKYETS